jgi:NAD(P)H-dependent FMN reductase
MKIIVLSSTVRVGRQSHQVAIEIAGRLNSREGISAEIIDLAECDLNNLEYLFKKDPSPSAIKKKIYQLFEECDAFVFVSPEYNGSYCGALKNAVDHFPKTCYYRKPIAVTTVSSGAMGGMRAALQMQLLVLALKAYPVPEMLLTPKVEDKFDEGKLIDERFKKTMDNFINEFVWLASKLRS